MAKLVDRVNWWMEVQPKLTPAASNLLAIQVLQYVDRNCLHWYSNRSMAADTGMSERHVRRCQVELEDAGLIRRTRRWSDGPGQFNRQSDLVEVLVSPAKPPSRRVT